MTETTKTEIVARPEVERPTGIRERARLPLTALAGLSSIHRGATGIVVGSVLILWPGVALSVVVAFIGAALIVVGLPGAIRAIRHRNLSLAGRTVFEAVIGAALIVVSSVASDLIAAALTIGLVARGLFDGYSAVRAYRGGGPWAWYTLRSIGQLMAGVAIGVLGEGVIVLILLLIGVTWLVGGVLTLWTAFAGHAVSAQSSEHTAVEEVISAVDPTYALVVSWFRNQDVGLQARQAITDKLIFEGADLSHRVARYASLMAFATAIAALGIQTDSTAVVIGAMLVAPLMTPIMATSLSLVLGQPTRAIRSLGLVAGGVGIAVGLAFLIARYAPGVVEMGSNSQIASRTAPTLLDLLIALAAGCAGGYAVCRPDVSDSLPGVAIAVALVPPLAVVGITLAAGEFVLASGAFLLFLTNLVGIIVASGLIFSVTGVAPWAELARNAAQLRRASITVFIALVLVSIPLAITGRRILADATNHELASDTTQTWLDQLLDPSETGSTPEDSQGLPSLEIVQVGLDGDVIEVVLIGDEPVTDASGLAERLTDALGQDVSLQLRVIPETRINIEPG